jgi:hypothetical protein
MTRRRPHDPGCRAHGNLSTVVFLDVHHCDECRTLSVLLRLTEWVAIEEREPA